MKIERFEDFEVWQLARILVKDIYTISKEKNISKDFGFTGQIQRCAVSIMANIAEGFERSSKKEFIRFLNISKASCGELRSHLYIALDIDYIDKSKFDNLYNQSEAISKSLAGFIKYLGKFNETKN